MGTLYRRQVRVCTTCQCRLDTTTARRRCETAGHVIEVRAQGPWWMRYHVDGRLHCASTHCDARAAAEARLNDVEGQVLPRRRTSAIAGGVRFEDAAEEVLTDYRTNHKRSLRTVALRIAKHLTPFFGGRDLATIDTRLIRQFTLARQAS